MSDNQLPQHVIDAFWQRWGNNTFMRAQGQELDIVGAGEAVERLPQVTAAQRGGGGSDTVLNGGVIAYMFDGALGCAIASSLLARPDIRGVDPRSLRQSTINLDITYIDAASGDRFEACGRVVRASRNVAFAEGELLDAQGRTCATARGIWRIFWPREPAPTRP